MIVFIYLTLTEDKCFKSILFFSCSAVWFKKCPRIRKIFSLENSVDLGHKASAATRNINSTFGLDLVSYPTARRWFQKFRSGRNSTKRKHGSGRPVKIHFWSPLPISIKKRMLCIFWSIHEPLMWELLPTGTILNSNMYINQLSQVDLAYHMQRRQGLFNGPLIFHHNNASPHKSILTTHHITHTLGWKVLPHTPCPFRLSSFYFPQKFLMGQALLWRRRGRGSCGAVHCL